MHVYTYLSGLGPLAATLFDNATSGFLITVQLYKIIQRATIHTLAKWKCQRVFASDSWKNALQICSYIMLIL